MKFWIIKTLLVYICLFHLSFLQSAPLAKATGHPAMLKTAAASPKEVIIQFLKWYKINLTKANSFQFVKKDSAGNFMVNKPAYTRYLTFLRTSKCLSPRYIAYWQSFFDDKAIGLQSNPVQSDIPDGFDFDLVLITQEPELILYHIGQTKFKTISLSDTHAVIGLSWPLEHGMQYNIEMHKGKLGWQIEYIATPNFD
ncbi:MAG: hypothetical protein ABI151_04950 [Chitinophagaceae bacterium]